MDILFYLVFVVTVAVVVLALLKIRHTYGDSGTSNEPASVEVDGEFSDGAKHVKQVGIRPCCTMYARLTHSMKIVLQEVSLSETSCMFQIECRRGRGHSAIFFS